jgi:copper chaperone NosL
MNRVVLLFSVLSLAACGGEERASAGASAHAEPIAEHECGSCGMIVREQPAPRAQVVHRDGTHAWFCSVGDVVAYLGAPSPHGRIEHVWVEVVEADVDLASTDVSEGTWVESTSAHYVLGVARPNVMGTPVLAFASAADAASAASRLGGRPASWSEVVTALGGTP